MILITGASGFVGSELVKELVKRKKRVRCLLRKKKDINTEVVYGDLRDKKSIEDAVKGVDTVIHLGALILGSKEELIDVNIKGTKNLVNSVDKNTKFIFISSIYAGIENSAYGYTKRKGEEAVKAKLNNWVILRPSLIYGKNDFFITRIIRARVMPVIGNGRYKNQPVYIKDVVNAIIKVLEKDVKNKTYNIAGPHALSYNKMLDIISEEFKIRFLRIHIPFTLINFITKIYKTMFRNTKLPLEQIQNITNDKTADINMAAKDIGYSPISFRQGIRLMGE
ncbi:MAG: NAD-dependent epimerase/dehydratase family protein [Candidatus Aenigmarchaeota archaeon]|nr:NAD-dependent epimerase/dehydratase family protein [Candidatus Aenigmarchaeota archaeon]